MEDEYQKYNPTRSPAWRWERVLELTEGGVNRRVSRQRDDRFVREAKQFFVDYQRLPVSQRQALFLDNPGLSIAYNTYSVDDEYLQCSWQAHLLTGKTHKEIASLLGVPVGAIDWYEALFFNVSDRIQNKRLHRPWVIRQILGPAATRGIADRCFDVTAKLFAYFSGYEAMRIVTEQMTEAKEPTSQIDQKRYMDEVQGFGVRRASSMNSLTFEVNKFNVMQLFEIHSKLQELEVTKLSVSGPTGDFEKQVVALLSDVENVWTVGSEAVEMWKDNPLGQFQGLPAELRADEAMLVASGKGSDGLLDDISKLRLPPPRRITNEDPK